MKFIINEKFAGAYNNAEKGRSVVLRYLHNCLFTEEELDKELERLYVKYDNMLTLHNGRDENHNYIPEFCKGALALIDEIDSADGVLPDE